MKYLFILLFTVMLLPSCAQDETAKDTKDANATTANADAGATEAMIRKFYEAMSAGKTDELGQYVAADFVDHQEMQGYESNLEGMKKLMGDVHAAYEGFKMTPEAIIVDGDQAVARFRMSGKNVGAFMGMPATGKMVDVGGVDWLRIKDGKVVEHWGYMEEMKWMMQLGMMPGAEGAPDAGATAGGNADSGAHH